MRYIWDDSFGIQEVGNSEIYIIQSLFLLLIALRFLVLNLEPLHPLALFGFSFPFLGVVVRRSKRGESLLL